MLVAFIFLIAFLLGSIPSGYVIGRMYGVNLQKEGSGSIGATNAKRVLGNKAGLMTLLFDLAKGIAAVYLASLYTIYAGSQYADAAELIRPFLGFAAILGHCYSPFLRFRGGKGVATSLGVFVVLAPLPALLSILVFILVFRLSGFVSLSSITATIFFAMMVWLAAFGTYPSGVVLVAIFTTALIIIRHRENVSRLIAGTELSSKHKA